MATREALAIRREAAFARIAAAGYEPPAANRDPDVTLTQLVEWAAEVICGPETEELLVELDGSGDELPPADDTEKTAPARKSNKATE